MARAILLIDCPDQVGIIATTTNYLQYHQGNVVELEQHVDESNNRFFMRIEWELDRFDIPREKIKEFFQNEVGNKYQMNAQLYFTDHRPRMAIMVSKYSHCLYDILYRVQSGEWDVEVPLIISNHDDLRYIAERFDIPYHHIPVTKSTKQEAEQRQFDLLNQHETNFVVLARYMQILSPWLVSKFPNQVINIHHSFLPPHSPERSHIMRLLKEG